MTNSLKILVYGYGNPGRKDDGLGSFLADRIEKWIHTNRMTDIHVDSNYQLNIEDACNIKDYDIVIFADASIEDIEHFRIESVTPSGKVSFHTHSVSPGFVLDLCHRLFNKDPLAFLLHIRGYEFSMEESLSHQAMINLEMAFELLTEILMNPKKFYVLNKKPEFC